MRRPKKGEVHIILQDSFRVLLAPLYVLAVLAFSVDALIGVLVDTAPFNVRRRTALFISPKVSAPACDVRAR